MEIIENKKISFTQRKRGDKMSKYPYRQDREEIKILLEQFENLKAGRPNSYIEEEGFEKIVEYFEDLEKDYQALEVVDYGLNQYPSSVSLLLSKANLLIIIKKYREALSVLDEVEAYDTQEIDLYILRTDAYLALDMQQKAAKLLEYAIEIFEGEDRINLLFELSDVYDDYENFEKVFDCLKMILEQDPNNEEALYKICFWTDYTGRNEESIKIHQQIIEEFPYNELAWFNLGAAYQGLKLHEKAIDAYLYAIAIDEKFDVAYRNLGDAYMRIRNYKEAIDALEKVITLSMPDAIVHEAIAYCYARLHNPAQARFHYKKALHLQPEDSHLFFKIATTYMDEKQWQAAIKLLEKAIAIKSSVIDYHLALGQCFLELGRMEEAVVYLENVVRLKPKNLNGWKQFLKCLFQAGLYIDGLEYAVAAFDLLKKPLMIYYRSMFLFALGKNKEAMATLEKALILQPKIVKSFIELDPSILQQQPVVDLIARYKLKKGK